MIQVYADGAPVYSPDLDGYELLVLSVTNNIDKAGTATLTVPPGHPAYNAFTSFRTVVTIHRRGALLFRGRVLYPEDDFYCRRKITCEGERCFLQDGVMRAYSYAGTTPAAIFRDAIAAYNSQVEPFKRFRVGVTNVTGTVELFECVEAEQVSDTIDTLVEEFGGFITFSTDFDGVRVINWVQELSGRSDQAIEFGENLLDFSRSGANTDLATAIIPYGAKDEQGNPLTIESVNDGRDYVQDDAAVALYGSIVRVVYFDDVTDPEELLARALAYLSTSKLIVTSLELSAVDLSALDQDVDTFEPGDWVRVISAPHAVDDLFQIRERSYNLLQPSQDKVVCGKDVTTLTGSDVAGDKNSRTQLQRAQQTIKADYTQAIKNSEVGLDDTVANNLRVEMAAAYGAKVNTAGQYMTGDGLLLQWGTLIVTQSAALSFLYAYAEAPTVIVTPAAAASSGLSVGVSAAATTGATVTTSTTAALTVYWLAIGRSATALQSES